MSVLIDIPLNEMANLQTYRTKLDYPLWIDEKGSKRKTKYNRSRLKVCISNKKSDEIPVSIDKDNPKILVNREIKKFSKISQFIIKYYDELMAHWNHEWDSTELSQHIDNVERKGMTKKDSLLTMIKNRDLHNGVPKSLQYLLE